MTPALVALDAGSTILIILLVLIGIALLVVLGLVGMYNGLVRLRNQVEESWHQVDVELQRRYDLIPNLVETVKAYAGHERNTLEEVVRLRNQAASMAQPGALPTPQRAEVEAQLSQAVSRLLVTVEAYPDLKANANFVELMRSLEETEDRIAAGRRFYNANVRAYNTKIESFPSNILAGMFKFTKATYFEVNDPEVRSAQRIDFGTMSQSGPTASQLNAQAAGQGAIPAQTYQSAYPSSGAQQSGPFGQAAQQSQSLPQTVEALPQNASAPQASMPASADAKAAALNDPSEAAEGQQTIFAGTEPGQSGQPLEPNPQFGQAQYGNPMPAQALPGEYGSAQQPAAPLTDPYGAPVDPNKPYGK